jgi:hypothetical protein
VRGDEGADESADMEGEMFLGKLLLLLFDLDGLLNEDCVTNLGCECERRSWLEEK